MDHAALLGTAAVIGFLHTLLGPDHYLPFVAMARIGRWSTRKTLAVTVLCGLAHVASSVLLGAVGIAGGVVLLRLEDLESHRAELAGWLLLGFGMAYLVWGLLHAFRRLPHAHLHAHVDGTVHQHEHAHQGEHLHAHAHGLAPGREAARGWERGVKRVPDRGSERLSDAGAELRAEFGAELGAEPSAQRISEPASALVSATASNASNAAGAPNAAGTSGENGGGLTPWVLFTIFLFGPCEPLIPMLMYPASQANAWLVVLVASVFALVTVGTMTVAVLSMLHGISRVSLGPWQRFGHALAGLAVTGCGLAVKFGL